MTPFFPKSDVTIKIKKKQATPRMKIFFFT
jgi:hypothetical protein